MQSQKTMANLKTSVVVHCKEVKNTQYNTNQCWTRFLAWWDNEKCSIQFDDQIFPATEVDFTALNGEELMMELSHRQRSFILSKYVAQLRPLKQNITHYEGNALKNYVDAIVRKMRQLENCSNDLSEKYGNWSCWTDNAYMCLRQTLSQKVTTEHFEHPRKKRKTKSDSITNTSFRALISRTYELAEEYKQAKNMWHYVTTMSACAVFVIIYFCGTRARQEVADTLATDFTDHHPALIEFEQSCDSKGKKLKSNYTFVQRASSFIVGEFYCSVIRFFLEKRPPGASQRFFLYAANKATFSSKYFLSAKNVIGKNPLGDAMRNHTARLINEDLICDGNYTNTSLRKGLMDHLLLVGVPPGLADCCLGHFNTNSGTISAGFSATGVQNASYYATLFDMSITRKKIALLLFSPQLTWKDIENDDAFHLHFKKVVPHSSHNLLKAVQQEDPVQKSDTLLDLFGESDDETPDLQFLEKYSPNYGKQCAIAGQANSPFELAEGGKIDINDDVDSDVTIRDPSNSACTQQGQPPIDICENYTVDIEFHSPPSEDILNVDENFLMSLMTPPNSSLKKNSASTQRTLNQHNAVAFSKHFAPHLNVYGGNVNITYNFGSN